MKKKTLHRIEEIKQNYVGIFVQCACGVCGKKSWIAGHEIRKKILTVGDTFKASCESC